jgi:hypothetical protein
MDATELIRKDDFVSKPLGDAVSTVTDLYNSYPQLLRYTVIGIVIIFVSTKIVKAGPSHIFAIIAIYVIISNLQTIESQSTMDFNEEMDYRLDLLGTPSHFYLDANIINLFYSIYSFRNLNAYNFDNAIKAVNNMLKIEEDASNGLQRCVDNYEVAYDLKNNAMNLIHGFVYSLYQPLLITKLKRVLRRLQDLLERHLNQIQSYCEQTESKKKNRDVNSRFIEDALGPKPYDAATMTPFDYYN